ncbi:hypothetical protein SAMN05216251_108208 [Actinacidiphila alni]|uniref:Tryptophan-rich sensory protein n=1 Tax=Actinacidiphila alni TaxID=380248 RepID=A0A1I2G2B7_9ACTN|nr:hypothetical protein [Actinacidiphila alni]SFF11279.1 hypothetical protein SAMN05216251_108208 [Actinacidiphila alni]
MRAAPVRLACARVGWRGLALVLSGVAWISYGAGLTVQPRYGTVRGITVLLHLLPMTAWGCLWIACGVACLLYALAGTGRDQSGLVAAVVPPLLWAVAYALGGMVGVGVAWSGVAPWASHAGLIYVIARVTRPPRIVVVGADGES